MAADHGPGPGTVDRILRVGFATDGPILAWQARCLEALTGVDGVRVERWFQGDHEQPWPGDDVEPGKESKETPGQLDILLDLTRLGLRVPPKLAREAWHFSYGPGHLHDPSQAALVDYVRTPGRSKVALVSEPGSRILREGMLFWSRGEQLDRILFDPAEWPAIVARDRLDRPEDLSPVSSDLSTSVDVDAGSLPRDRLATVPVPMLKGAAIGRRILGAGRYATRHDDWNIGLVSGPIQQFVTAPELPAIAWLGQRPGHFAADPFGVEREGRLHIFFEDYDQSTGRGSIAYRSIDAAGAASEVETVLDPGVHASYPFIVERNGTTFMLPETSAAGELVLYEAVNFPRSWRRTATLLSLPVADATVIEFEGRWWMFATRADRGPNNNLFIWHAPDLLGPWSPHAGNPVKTDARSARPGGTPFVALGRLYRPSQDSARNYGGSLVINQVEVLTPQSFAERPIRTFLPEPGSDQPDGLHTLSAIGRWTLVDGNRKHFVPATLKLTLNRRLGLGRGAR
jgi:hypothetical protein